MNKPDLLYNHIPVMLKEVIFFLNCRPGKIYVDCTLGGSGHSLSILEKTGSQGLLIGIDQDKDAVAYGWKRLKEFEKNIRLFHANFTDLPEILNSLNIKGVDGIIADLGLSLHHIKHSGRGFSFNNDEPLDMRMNINNDLTAHKLVNTLKENELGNIFWKYGEETRARRIAREIVKSRKKEPVNSSADLAEIVSRVCPKNKKGSRYIHPATKVFMALRIAVNRELENLETFMEQVPGLLNPKARLCILSFHSLEDRIVKHQLKSLAKGCTCPPVFPQCVCHQSPKLKILTRKPVMPGQDEINQNPMSRSTRLRAAEKI
ncbi:Ribosomal RNA small subunit methyltransferase [Desulfonema limicola]|uniref:Ribosomal RNA small subunit methyltransferase H n=1 Tax=Desulfonema limicola TaxID=45656 RepID=A0A975GI25_9BACT|nr:16S rRNA (cytosine(1402)-N(4))-methyltransferase RsmH [Desulfonema limicola]QTA82092.1 Ribosomal RNA small subunit methyltransferase [Desulfonema limicola]